ncbi:MAG: nitroreductase family protein [Armatimonadetes bacterium]|nr:nitroreductase family protein [Armatimonadota bacterium]
MLKEIWERASVRRYKPDPVPEDALEEILRAAMHAPTANNVRPWHIVVVTDAETRRKLSEVHQWAGFCAESPVVLAFCGDPAKSEHWWIEDCCAAVENAMIEAVSHGLGTCWIGIRGSEATGMQREDLVRDVLGIPDSIRVLALVSLGYPADQPSPKGPGPMSAVHRERW